MESILAEQSGKDLYKKLTDKRKLFMNRAWESSELTMPQLFPRTNEDTDTSSYTYPTPYQSVGARGVNNLANKIVLTLFPPATAFFKLGINPLIAAQMDKGEGEVETALYTLEKALVDDMEVSQLRSALVETMKQGIVGGSAILHIPANGDFPHVINMRDFGIKRSKSGVVLQMCIRDSLVFSELDSNIQSQIEAEEDELSDKKPLIVYTLIMRTPEGKYDVVQEINGQHLSGTEGTFIAEELPYIFIPFVDRGEDYGRSYIEDFIGDLKSYEGLRKAILEAAAESARLIYLVKPNGLLSHKKLQSAQSGDVLVGSEGDVSVIQADKRLDMQVTQQEADVLRQDLSTAFLMDSAVRRNAERVTAEEIRKVSQELEVALGGIYSTMANVLQKPVVFNYLKRLRKRNLINKALTDSIQLEVTTGSAALGRGTEFNAISTFTQALTQVLGEQFGSYVNMGELISRVANSLDIGTSKLIKTDEDRQMEQQQQHQQQLEQQAVSPAINAASKAEQQQA